MRLAPLRMMDRLILREFLPLFGIGILTFSVLIASFTILKDAVEWVARGIPVGIVAQGFLLGLAQVISYTLPMGVLLGALMAFGRLSSSGEITALRAGGINFLRIAAPVLVAGYFISCLAFLFNERVAPRLNLAAQELLREAAVQLGVALSGKRIVQFITNRDGGYWILGAESSSGQTLNQVILVDHDGRGSYTIYEARQAEWNQDHWVLRNVNYLRWQPGADPPVPPLATSAAELTIDLRRTPSDILRFQRNVEELSLAELKAYIREQERQFAEDAADLEALEADPAAVPSEIAGSTRDLEKLQMEIRKNWAKYHLKISTPFACLIFALLAAPLGMNPLRATSSIGFGLSMILVFVYYFLAQSGVNFAANGLVHPAVLAWIPNAVFILYGLWLNGQFVWSSGK